MRWMVQNTSDNENVGCKECGEGGGEKKFNKNLLMISLWSLIFGSFYSLHYCFIQTLYSLLVIGIHLLNLGA